MIMNINTIVDTILPFIAFISKKTFIENQLDKIVNIYDALNTLTSNPNVHRAVVIKIENSGGLINSSTPLYSSVLQEEYKFPVKSIKQNFQRVLVDQQYIKIIIDAVKNKYTKIQIDRLSDSLLKYIYKADNIQYSEVHFLKANKKAVYFLSIATINESFNEDSELTLNINLAVNKIKNNL